jgi:hypothetical protein
MRPSGWSGAACEQHGGAIGGQDKGTEAQGTLVDLDGTDAVVLVGVGLGDWTEPFDPEGAEWEPHGWLATIAAE